jgi:hypothetical protein
VLVSCDGRLALLLLTGALALVPVVFAARDGQAQTSPWRATTAQAGPFVAEEWRLRGVVLSEPARFAVLQHAGSSRQHVLRVGDAVQQGVALESIAADRVVLDADGRAITLRLAHGGERVSARRPAPRPVPRPISNRRCGQPLR